ncbi:hypothetical protein DID76_03225 [Candidatus Marinamargulisbacteria bacterium SCGC AG-414-C22]|nr:hypothetical protein DID76_03225 [Candidatus Marinamargulisbacteria bacterium SCGC AG-414-C22]
MADQTNNSENSQETEVEVINEDEFNKITYSKNITIKLYEYVVNTFSSLKVPYSTIKIARNAREMGVRQITYEIFSRPDTSSHFRAKLDLWGFKSYVNYLYTVCELGFLEGLIPVVDFDFLTPDEIKELYDVVALFKCSLFTEYDFLMNAEGIRSIDHSNSISLKRFEWVNKLGCPNIAGFFAYKGQDVPTQRRYLNLIANSIEKYDIVHEVCIYTKSRLSDCKLKPIDFNKMKSLYNIARNIIPEHVPILFPDAPFEMVKFLYNEGELDLGSFDINDDSNVFADVNALVTSDNKVFQQRFPLRKSFIHAEKYSNKLGQVFDAYKYKIKKQIQERLKEAKQ